MTARLLTALVIGVLAALGGPVAAALAAPTVAIESPQNGTIANQSRPTIAGVTSDAADPVTVKILAHGTEVESSQIDPGDSGAWSVRPPATLQDGSYEAVAEQTETLTGEPGESSVGFTVDTKPPTVTLNAIAKATNDTTPSFSGFASDSSTVVVKIFRNGSQVASATAEGTGADWSSGAAAPELPEGSYTAFAVQESSIGNEAGKSETIGFSVATAPPKVTLNGVHSPSGDTAPTFAGTASDTTSVSILIYRGGQASGELAASAGATGTGGNWTSGHAAPGLTDGEYTAVATQESSLLGNPTGVSNEVTFVIDTHPPSVTLNGVPSPSKDTTPSFSGTATDSTAVTVHVLDEAQHEVATATGSPSGGSWKAGSVSKALSSGSYTAIATEPSSLGNAAGESSQISFSVNTQSPRVTLDQPAQLSADTTPSFSGTASDTSTVTVSVYAGSSPGGSPVTTASAAGTGGAWTSASVETALANGTYTALARQQSTLGNPEGVSEPKTFKVDTNAPTVTLEQPAARSGNRLPAFSGTASETTPVTVSVYSGSSVSGTLFTTASASGTGGAWSSGPVGTTLPDGTYTVVASQHGSFGKPEGKSEAWTFQVDTSSPKVTLNQPQSPSNRTRPSFSGTATEATEVDVHVMLGGEQVREYRTTAAGGVWKTGPVTPELSTGAHAYRVYATELSAIGNVAGQSPEYPLSVNTEIGLEAVPSPSNNRKPSFSGTSAESHQPVVVHVLQEGNEVASASATPSGGTWSTGPLSSALGLGRTGYTAYASQAGTAENPEARSATISFLIDTTPPEVALDPVAAASSDATPSFSGTTSQAGEEVKVLVYRGSVAKGTPVATAAGHAGEEVSPGLRRWSTGEIPSLGARAGTYTAIARQRSAIGNPEGESKPSVFLVDPDLPKLTMAAVRSQLNTSAPAFSGTSDQGQPVEVEIYARSARTSTCEVEGAAISSARSATGGAWATGAASPGVPDGAYAAVARQSTAIPADPRQAATAPSCFAIDTSPPVVALAAPSSGALLGGGPVSVSGTAGTATHDLRQVTVQLFAGEGVGASPLQQVVVSSPAGSWSAVLSSLAPGTYTVRAEQADEAGNVGASSGATFRVGAAATAATAGLTPHFTWYPARPHVGEAVSLLSDSLDAASPLTGYAWALDGKASAAGGPSLSTTFATPGSHVVQLRVSDASGRSALVSQVIPVTYPLMRPFPVVRIVTTRTVGRVRLEVLSVRAPAGAGVEVSCTGRGCPLRSQTRKMPSAHKAAVPAVAFTRFERSLPPGVALHIRVFKAGSIGKYTLFTIRRGKLPVRSDSCVSSTDPKPVRCPS